MHRADDQQVHNLTVDDLHTYYVTPAPQNDLLTHNEARNDDCRFTAEQWADRIDDDGIEHSLSRHSPDGEAYREGKDSVWSGDVDEKRLQDLVNATENETGKIQRNPRGDVVEFAMDAGSTIGKTPNGDYTSKYTVIRDYWSGDLITAHPGPPVRPD